MPATFTFDIFCSLDGFGSYGAEGDWGGYWGKQGPELLAHRARIFDSEQRMVFGATTFRETAPVLAGGDDPNALDEWNVRTLRTPATVISSTLRDTLGWPDATIVSGDAVDIVTRLKQESGIPLRSQGSLSLNRALLAAGLEVSVWSRTPRELAGIGLGGARQAESPLDAVGDAVVARFHGRLLGAVHSTPASLLDTLSTRPLAARAFRT